MWTLPNLLSLFRILLVPFLAYLMSFTDPVSCALAALVFIIAAVTDMLDGYLARRNKSVSDFGKILDPLADKLLVVTALIMLVAIDRPGDAYLDPGRREINPALLKHRLADRQRLDTTWRARVPCVVNDQLHDLFRRQPDV